VRRIQLNGRSASAVQNTDWPNPERSLGTPSAHESRSLETVEYRPRDGRRLRRLESQFVDEDGVDLHSKRLPLPSVRCLCVDRPQECLRAKDAAQQ
jgi:hypothetical protein